MAQIHALLYASEEPLDTDEIMGFLQISRGNANMNLRSLLNWDLVHKVHLTGSRKDYYKAEKDVWRIMIRIIKERQKREITPVQEQLQRCLDILACGSEEGHDLEQLNEVETQYYHRIDNLIELLKVFDSLFENLFRLVQEYNMDEARDLISGLEQMAQDIDRPTPSK